eukprot:3853085-Alexandrium_andersonii.AAC.1
MHPQARLRALEGEQANHIDATLAEVPAMQADAGGQDAAQLLVVYVMRQAGARGIGGQLAYRCEPAEPPQTHIEFVLFVAETGT